MVFFDTCALIEMADELHKEEYRPFVISRVTLQELEKIKNAKDKSEELKIKVRKLIRALYHNEDQFIVAPHSNKFSLDNDEAIINDAFAYAADHRDTFFQFFTYDLNCYFLAKERFTKLDNIIADYREHPLAKKDDYTGFKAFAPMNAEAENELYEYVLKNINFANLLENEYLIINCGNGKKDYFKWRNNQFERVPFRTVESMHFGIFKPRNDEQILALDSMFTNRITLLGGPAGSGKSAASLAYLFNQLENGKIDRIIVFCNPVAAKNAAKLGFYPGELKLKLLSSQVGNVLTSKIGDSVEVDRLIDSGQLVLIPAADLRGYETPAHSGVYIMEGQNYDTVLMRMLLQRIGNECQVIIDGDREEQTDLDIYENDNGMKKVSQVFRGEKIFGQVDLQKIERDEIARIAERMK